MKILNFVYQYVNKTLKEFGEAISSHITSTNLEVTYDHLRYLISTKKLYPGKIYKIVDYQTVYDQPDYDVTGTPKPIVDTLTGPVEPLLVLAINEFELARQVWSEVHPNDIIMYDINFTKTEVMNTPAKGRITIRTDEDNNTIGYDHRAVVLKRYESGPGSGIFNQVKDNGEASVNLPTFGLGCDNVNVTYIREEVAGFDDPVFIVSNNVFGEYCEEVVCGQDFYNNTIGDFCYGTTFNHWCHDNIIASGFNNNTIANEFSFNVIDTMCSENLIQNSFQNNTIGTNFSNNSIGNNFGLSGGNIINNIFYSNVIEDEFANNTIGTGFIHNYISDYFQNATLNEDFQNNHIKVACDGTEAFDTTKAYLTSYCEVIDGYDAGGSPFAQRFIGWFDTTLGKFSYAGL